MKREIGLFAEEGDVSIKIEAAVVSGPKRLTEDELDHLKSKLVRELAIALARLPYTDFGFENIRLD